MKLRNAILLGTVSLLATFVAADDKAKPTVVDSGSFGIMVKGARVATETFRVEQRGTSSVVVSELRTEDASKASQTAELEMAANGGLKRYTWKETKPGDATIVVEPQDEQFLSLRWSEGGTSAPKNTTMALTAATSIVDDNFFSQMQVLVWKYMAMGCRQTPDGQNECVWTPRKLPTLNPHQQEPMLINIEYGQQQRFKLKGVEHSYKIFRLKGESTEWTLYFSDDNKLVRVLIPAESAEVVRD